MPKSHPMDYDHFTIPKAQKTETAPGFFDENFELILTEESKRLFELGRPKQGYVGLVELPYENEITPEGKKRAYIHLIPADNKDSGTMYGVDKNGNKLTMLKSVQPLGGNTGDLHLRAAGMLGLGEKQGANGYLMGFGIWKSGYGVKILPELPNREALIPGEFILAKENDRWVLNFTLLISPPTDIESGKVDMFEININDVPGLEEALNVLSGKDISKLTYPERIKIENILRELTIEGIRKEPEETIGVIKNRSSSQNQFSVVKDEIFREFFNDAFLSARSSHGAQFVRELPLPVLEKIMKSIMRQLGLPVVNDLLNSGLIPGDISGPGNHLLVERDWIKMNKKEREEEVLHRLIERGDLSVLKKIVGLLKSKKTEKEYSELLSELLFFSVEEQNTAAMDVLLKEGVLIDSVNEKGETPLMCALQKGYLETFRALMSAGASVNSINAEGDTLLMYACRSGVVDICLDLIQYGADVNARNKNNDTPLIAACRAGPQELCLALIREGADVNVKNNKNESPLLAACNSLFFDLALELISKGADVNVYNGHATPLMAAASAGHVQTCLMLIENGANVNVRAGMLGNALLCAIRDIDKENEVKCNQICLKLIEKNVELNVTDFFGNTPLRLAAEKGFTQVCVALIRSGADVTADFLKIVENHDDESFKQAIQDAISSVKPKEGSKRESLIFSKTTDKKSNESETVESDPRINPPSQPRNK